jgi:hypothetical protein
MTVTAVNEVVSGLFVNDVHRKDVVPEHADPPSRNSRSSRGDLSRHSRGELSRHSRGELRNSRHSKGDLSKGEMSKEDLKKLAEEEEDNDENKDKNPSTVEESKQSTESRIT